MFWIPQFFVFLTRKSQMLAKIVASLAVIGSAAAYAPTMSAGMGRRDLLKTAAAGAVVAPLLRPNEAEAVGTVGGNAARYMPVLVQ